MIEDRGGKEAISRGHEEEGLGPSVGSAEEAFAVGVFADAFEDSAACVCHFGEFGGFGVLVLVVFLSRDELAVLAVER